MIHWIRTSRLSIKNYLSSRFAMLSNSQDALFTELLSSELEWSDLRTLCVPLWVPTLEPTHSESSLLTTFWSESTLSSK